VFSLNLVYYLLDIECEDRTNMAERHVNTKSQKQDRRGVLIGVLKHGRKIC